MRTNLARGTNEILCFGSVEKSVSIVVEEPKQCGRNGHICFVCWERPIAFCQCEAAADLRASAVLEAVRHKVPLSAPHLGGIGSW